MITGDYHHTAIAVAKQAGMVRPGSEIVIVDIPKHIHSQQSRVGMTAAGATFGLRAAPPSPELTTSMRPSEDSLPDVSRLISARSSDLQSLRARLANLERLQAEESRFAGLRFVDGESNQEMDASDALASLAEGRGQCAVTGPAFKLLLQQQELSVSLQVIMQSAVVFARMQPHQKGEAMDLITSQGIHQLTAPGSHYIAVIISLACSVCQAHHQQAFTVTISTAFHTTCLTCVHICDSRSADLVKRDQSCIHKA